MESESEVSIFRHPVSVKECNEVVERLMKVRPRIRKLVSGKLYDLNHLTLAKYENEEVFTEELVQVRTSLTGVSLTVDVEPPKVDVSAEIKVEDERRAWLRKLRKYKFTRVIRPVRLKKGLTPIPVTMPELRRDIVLRNIRTQSSLSKQSIAEHMQEVFHKRDESLKAVHTRHQQLTNKSKTDDIRARFKAFNTGVTVPRTEVLISTGIAAKFATLAKVTLETFRANSGQLTAKQIMEKLLLKIPVTAVQFVQAMYRAYRRRLASREKAVKILRLLKTWKKSGTMIVTMHRFHSRVRRAQEEIRKGLHNMAALAKDVSDRWVLIEKEMIAAEVAQLEHGSGKQGMTRRTNLVTISEPLRTEHVHANLRFLRRRWAQEYIEWRHDMIKYKKLVEEWRNTRNAKQALGDTHIDPPPKHPFYPVFRPNDDEIAVMITQCRKGILPHVTRIFSKDAQQRTLAFTRS